MRDERHANMRKLRHVFYRRAAADVAQDLIGAILTHQTGRQEYRARIVETEAYVGPHDLACHASRGRTRRTEVMFGPGGRAYVYFIYGMYEMFNIVTGRSGDPQAVLIRAAEPLGKWEADLSGPGKLTRAFQINRSMNGLDLTGDELYLTAGPDDRPHIMATKRVGVDYAQDWKDALLRFYDANSKAVSKLR
jgi:DNA-3-methyladenine glycosylase